jgi:hypothetical protein
VLTTLTAVVRLFGCYIHLFRRRLTAMGLVIEPSIYHNLLRSFGLVTDEQRICISGDQA